MLLCCEHFRPLLFHAVWQWITLYLCLTERLSESSLPCISGYLMQMQKDYPVSMSTEAMKTAFPWLRTNICARTRFTQAQIFALSQARVLTLKPGVCSGAIGWESSALLCCCNQTLQCQSKTYWRNTAPSFLSVHFWKKTVQSPTCFTSLNKGRLMCAASFHSIFHFSI